MHKEILTSNQVELLPLVRKFFREYYLVGGTAIGLHLGHRRSIDFDLFKFATVNVKRILSKISEFQYSYQITRHVSDQLNINIKDVKFTFFEYPFQVQVKETFENTIRLPGLLDLAAMKAYALGRRSKWKDYVDLYFIIKYHFSITQISSRANEIFDQLFSEKLFRAQLSYFSDIDDSEPVEYLNSPVDDQEIKAFLVDKAVEFGF